MNDRCHFVWDELSADGSGHRTATTHACAKTQGHTTPHRCAQCSQTRAVDIDVPGE